MLCSAPGITCSQSISFSHNTRSNLWELSRLAGASDALVEEDITKGTVGPISVMEDHI